eukprot:6045801-Pyramimonas_sp.AAC.1
MPSFGGGLKIWRTHARRTLRPRNIVIPQLLLVKRPLLQPQLTARCLLVRIAVAGASASRWRCCVPGRTAMSKLRRAWLTSSSLQGGRLCGL